MNNSIFDELLAFSKPYCSGETFAKLVHDTMNTAARKIISNKPMFNAVLFENEQEGKKLNGKEIPEAIASDNCYATYFDKMNRVIVVENFSEFLSRRKENPYATDYIRYFYEANRIVALCGTLSQGCRYADCYIQDEQGKILCRYMIATETDQKDYRYCGSYHYEDNLLSSIGGTRYFDLKGTDEQYDFEYTEKGVLASIVRHSNGVRKYEYVTRKPKSFDFTAIKEEFKKGIKDSFEQILRESEEEIVAFGLYTNFEGAMIAPAANTEQHLSENIATDPKEEKFFTYAITEWIFEGTFGHEIFQPYGNLFKEYSELLPEDSLVAKFKNNLLDFAAQCLLEVREEGGFAGSTSLLTLMVDVSGGEMSAARRNKMTKLLNKSSLQTD